MFRLHEIDGLPMLQIDQFNETGLVHHGFSTRIGGSSQRPFDTFDVGIYHGNDLSDVSRHRRKMAKVLGAENDQQVVCCHQIHGTQIAHVDRRDGGKGFVDPQSAVADTDGLMTAESGVALMACFADCVPLFFLDPVKKVVAISHAGWRGTVGKIGVKTVKYMAERYASKEKDILVGIGPSIGPCHYQVDQPVIEQFQQAFNFWPEILTFENEAKAKLDLWKANQLQLMEIGILPEHITVSGQCTCCHEALFYSYRRDQGKTGRMAGMIMLK